MYPDNTTPLRPDAANGMHEDQGIPDILDRAIDGIERFVRMIETKNAEAEKQSSVPDDVPRFITEYRP